MTQSPTNPSDSPYAGPPGAARVLVVDDEPMLCDLLRQALIEEFAVAVVTSSEEALRVLAGSPPEVVLVDKNLPHISGLALLKHIKSTLPGVEVLMITGYASLESAVEALRLGACDYLIKPFPHVKVVVEKVRWAIERHKLLGDRLDLVNQLLRTNEELRQAVDSRRQSDERFRTLFNAVSDLVLVNTVNHNDVIDRFLEVNDAACQTLGYSREALLRMTAQQVLAPREWVAVPGMMSLLLAQHKVLFETEVVTKDGRGIAVEVHSSLLNLSGQLVVLSVARNTTDAKLMEVKRD